MPLQPSLDVVKTRLHRLKFRLFPLIIPLIKKVSLTRQHSARYHSNFQKTQRQILNAFVTMIRPSVFRLFVKTIRASGTRVPFKILIRLFDGKRVYKK